MCKVIHLLPKLTLVVAKTVLGIVASFHKDLMSETYLNKKTLCVLTIAMICSNLASL